MISPHDLGFLRGYAVFDYLMTTGGKPFLPHEHFLRLKKSTQTLSLPLPFTEKDWLAVIDRLIKKHNFYRAAIRTIITGGVSADGLSLGQKPTVLILISPFKSYPDKCYLQGVKVITADYRRYLPEIKTTHYIEAIRNQKRKRAAGALEIIFIKDGLIYEAATSNIFLFKNQVLITPKENILNGITRQLVLKLARKSFIIKERPVKVSELLKADEVFLTASGKGVMPVVKIDNRAVANGRVGENTKKIMGLFKKFYEAY